MPRSTNERLGVLTLKTLIAKLTKLIAEDEYRADMRITFGEDMAPVCGGIITRNAKTGLTVLNLAPISLDKIGGF